MQQKSQSILITSYEVLYFLRNARLTTVDVRVFHSFLRFLLIGPLMGRGWWCIGQVIYQLSERETPVRDGDGDGDDGDSDDGDDGRPAPFRK